MSRFDDGWHYLTVGLVVTLLVFGAGCSGLTDSSSTDGTTVATTDSPAADAPTTTAVSTTTAASTTTEGDGHDHSNETTSPDEPNAAMSGKAAVVIGDQRLDVTGQGNDSAAVWYDDYAPDVWYAGSDNATVADALSTLGVSATEDSVTYDGETYNESDENVSVEVRVNGHAVDPQEHTLSSGDEIWVTVETPDMDVSVPGNHIDHTNLHIHGSMKVDVMDHSIDFSRDKYQNPSHSRYFHFEGGNAQPWHAHSWSVSLGYALSTIPGLDASQDSVTYNGTTYNESDENVSVSVTVNGEEVDVDDYLLRDGDTVRIVVEEEN